MKTFSKLTFVAAAAVATVAAVRRYDLVNKGAALAEQGVDKAAAGAEWLTAKATELGEKFLDRFADEEDLASDPTGDDPTADDEALSAFGRRAGDVRTGFHDTHDEEGAGLR